MQNVSLSEIKRLKSFCEDQTSDPSWRDVLQCLLNDEQDFEVDNVRFIDSDVILSVMVDEIFSDDYTLGCFNAEFIADNSGLNYELVKACQQADAYSAIGQALNDTLDEEQKEAFCGAYASADGYGHHFNRYDFSESEFSFNGKMYHVFDNR